MSDGDGATTVRAGRRTVEVKRVDKVLFPGGGGAKEYTKGDLIESTGPSPRTCCRICGAAR